MAARVKQHIDEYGDFIARTVHDWLSVMPGIALADRRLRRLDLVVYGVLLSFMNKKHRKAWPSRQAISDRVVGGIELTRITDCTSRLEEFGYIRKEVMDSTGDYWKRNRVIYHFCHEKESLAAHKRICRFIPNLNQNRDDPEWFVRNSPEFGPKGTGELATEKLAMKRKSGCRKSSSPATAKGFGACGYLPAKTISLFGASVADFSSMYTPLHIKGNMTIGKEPYGSCAELVARHRNPSSGFVSYKFQVEEGEADVLKTKIAQNPEASKAIKEVQVLRQQIEQLAKVVQAISAAPKAVAADDQPAAIGGTRKPATNSAQAGLIDAPETVATEKPRNRPAKATKPRGGTETFPGEKKRSQRQKSAVPADDSPVVITIPVIAGPDPEFPVRQKMIDRYKLLFPKLDVEHELRLAEQWCMDHPSRRKTARGCPAFLTSWLRRSSQAPSRTAHINPPKQVHKDGPDPSGIGWWRNGKRYETEQHARSAFGDISGYNYEDGDETLSSAMRNVYGEDLGW